LNSWKSNEFEVLLHGFSFIVETVCRESCDLPGGKSGFILSEGTVKAALVPL
jgi:hypothetical protein